MSGTIHAPDAALLLADGTQLRVIGNVEVRSEIERVRSSTAMRPDMNWRQTDPHGHEHRYVRDEEGVPRLPSLEPRSRHIECDGSCGCHGPCDGYSITEWFCRECGDLVGPGFVPDYEAMESGIPISARYEYSLAVEGEVPFEDLITGAKYVYTAEGSERHIELPPLMATNKTGESGPDGWTYQTELNGWLTKPIERKPVGP